MAWDESLQRRKDVISNLLDGDGQAVKRVDLKETWVHSNPPQYVSSTKTEYYIRSSVLGGKVLTELREDGTKKQTNVYTGEAVIAEQMSFPADAQHQAEWGYVIWKHEDPVTGSYSRKRADGSSPAGSEPLPNAEIEPLGGKIPDEDPYDPTIPPPAGLRDFRYNGGDVFRPEYGCIVDGFVQEGPGLCTKMLENSSGRLNSNYDLLPAVASGLNIYAVPRAIVNNDAPTPPGVRTDSDAKTITIASYATTRYEYDYIFRGGPSASETSDTWVKHPLPGNFKDLLRKRLASTQTGERISCDGFIKSVIAKVTSNYNQELIEKGLRESISFPVYRPDAISGLELVDKVNSYVLVENLSVNGWGVGGTVRGSIKGNDATVLISQKGYFSPVIRGTDPVKMWTNWYVGTAIHELTHLAGNGVFTDGALAEAAFDLGYLKTRPGDVNSTDMGKTLEHSGEWSSVLRRFCGAD